MSIKQRLATTNSFNFAVYAALVTFTLYTCFYAFRKPFSAGLYADQTLWGFDLKMLYVMAEILGYSCSKLIATYVIPSVTKPKRVYYIMGFLGASEIAWLGFGLCPPYLKVVFTFLSGLPLGMIWGLMFSFIEGRRITEVLNVGISVAVIVSSGIVKTLGKSLMNNFGVPEYWMPFATGAVVIPLVILCCYLLNQIPEPNERDKVQRSERLPMNNKQKVDFIKQFFFGIFMLFVLFGSLTLFRELRDSFAANIWDEFGITDSLIFTKTEYPIAFIVLVLMTSIVFIYNNKTAINVMYGIGIVGAIISMVSTILFLKHIIDPVWWMTLIGLGLYMSYTIFTYLIERLIAALRMTVTAVFMVYLIDSFGCLGTAGVFITKNFFPSDVSWTSILVNVSIFSSIAAIVSIIACYFYFSKKIKEAERKV